MLRGGRSFSTQRVAATFLLSAAVILVSTLAVPGVSAAADRGGPIVGRAVRLRIARQPGRTIPAGFLGLSVEYFSVLPYFGSNPADLNPTFMRLVRNLNPRQSPVLRIGGGSTDRTWWPIPGMDAPAGIRLSIGPAWASVVRAVAAEMNAQLTFGIQFEADDGGIAGHEANELLQTIGPPYVAGFELGNEPEFYTTDPWYTDDSGAAVFGRPPNYGPNDYVSDFADIAAALPPSVPLAGPATGRQAFGAVIPELLAGRSRPATVTVHRYPLLGACDPYSLQPPSIADLLAPRSSKGLAATIRQAAAEAHAGNALLRVDELNSVACGGDFAISNSFAASLWSLDTLFAMARAGADGVNFHTFAGAAYAPFSFTHIDGVWRAQVNPLYYGLLAFTRAAPPGSRLLTIRRPANPTLRVWATLAPDGAERVTLINESPTASRIVALPAPPGAHDALTTALHAPSLSATDGVTLGGQAIAPNTTTGSMSGIPVRTVIAPVACHYIVYAPPASAKIVTIRFGRDNRPGPIARRGPQCRSAHPPHHAGGLVSR